MDGQEVRTPEQIMAMLEEKDPFLREIQEFRGLTPEQRYMYVMSTIHWLNQSIVWVLQADGKIQLGQRADVLQKSLKEKSKELIICALWTIKPQYRVVWETLLGSLVGMANKDAANKKGS